VSATLKSAVVKTLLYNYVSKSNSFYSVGEGSPAISGIGLYLIDKTNE